MTRFAAYLTGIVAIAALLCLPAIWSSGSSTAQTPWPANWDPVLGTSPALLVVVLVVGLVGAVVGGQVGANAGESTPSYVPTDSPPAGLGVAQAVHVLGEPVDGRSYVSTLLYAASAGVLSVRPDDGDWLVTGDRQMAGSVDVVTMRAVDPLLEVGVPFRAARESVEAGRVLRAGLANLQGETHAWGVRSGVMSRTGIAGRCAVLLVASVALVVVCLVRQPFGMSMLGVLPGTLLVCAVSMAVAGAGVRHTRRGRELWARVGGFRWVLATPASRHRFEFVGREELYASYVPWAVAFGCAQEWAQKYRAELGTEPPVPPFLGPYDGEHTADHVTAAVQRLSSAVRGAISTSEAERARPRRR